MMNDTPSKKKKAAAFLLGIGSGLLGLVIFAVGLYQLPSVQERIGWRVDFAWTYLRGVIDPVEAVPTVEPPIIASWAALQATGEPVIEPTASATLSSTGAISHVPTPTVQPTHSPTMIPDRAALLPPQYEE